MTNTDLKTDLKTNLIRDLSLLDQSFDNYSTVLISYFSFACVFTHVYKYIARAHKSRVFHFHFVLAGAIIKAISALRFNCTLISGGKEHITGEQATRNI